MVIGKMGYAFVEFKNAEKLAEAHRVAKEKQVRCTTTHSVPLIL